MKKFLVCLLSLVMALSLVACGGDTTDDTNTGDDTQVEDNTGDQPMSVLEVLQDYFVEAPSLSGTTWIFDGGYANGADMTDEQVTSISQQMDVYQYEFVDDTAVTLYEGSDTLTDGTYVLSEDGYTVQMSIGGITYNAVFVSMNDMDYMVVPMDSAGTTAIYFQLIIEG